MDLPPLKQELEKYGQEHLLQFWEDLEEPGKERFYNDLKSLDLARVKRDFDTVMREAQNGAQKVDERMKPVPSDQRGCYSKAGENLKVWEDIGLQKIGDSKVAVLLLAGGQGTRLGVNYPKGMYDVGLPSGKTLYQLQAERIYKLQQLAQKKTGKACVIPWYIMTSEHTMGSTANFLAEHNYFGLQKEDIILFEQHLNPCVTFEGKIILESKGKIARAPDGNGGLYRALNSNKIVDDMERRGVEYMHVYCVDNILVKMADPVFIGFCISKNADCGAKVVEKKIPTESVGVVCQVDGKYKVVEYSEISLPTAELKNADGRLTYNAGNICNHFFTIGFVKLVIRDHEDHLTNHIAKKKIPHVDCTGKYVKPESPNGIKLEKFVFDVFEFSDNFAVFEVSREDEFSPLKNGTGSAKDNAETARLSLLDLHSRYMIKAGARFIDSDGKPVNNQNNQMDSSVVCEISPLLSYAGEGLEDIAQGHCFTTTKQHLFRSPQEETCKNGEEPVIKKPKIN